MSAAILDRIDAALERAAFRQLDVRAIYLTVEDHDAFNAAMRKRTGWRNGTFLSYGDHQIRRGETSRIYSTHGVAVRIAKRLSAKVAA